MTQSDKWNKRDIVTRYYKYKDDVKFWSNKQDYTLSQSLSLIFCLPIPKSYKKNVLHDLVKVKPDLDNLIKAFKDSFNSNDSFVAEYGRMLKVYSDNPMIIIL
jgi:Holliday junction resolvase RusA-like endonuclease